MNENSSANRDQSRIPSDDQMDFLLRDFFRLEVPTALNQSLRRRSLATAAAATLTLVGCQLRPTSRTRCRHWHRWF